MKVCTRRQVLTGTAACAITATGAFAAPFQPRRGINVWPWFSLTREFPAPRTDYAWPPLQMQRPVPRPEDLQLLRKAGFDFVRIPVDPGPFLSFADPQRRILLENLMQAVRQCLAAGLGVVVNVQANEATHYWNSAYLTPSVDAPGFENYRALVADIAAALAQVDLARVALEPVNEPAQDCASAQWPQVQMALLAAARDAAPGLTLVATGACGSMVRGLEALEPQQITIKAPLLYTFHFYEPYLFTHQGAPWMREPVYRNLNNVPWPASAGSLQDTLASVRAQMARDSSSSAAEKADAYALSERELKVYFDAGPDRRYIAGYFAKVRAWAARNHIMPSQILMGEFGVLRSDARYVAAAAPDRARYIRDVREEAEAAGFAWAFWNLFDGMGLMDDATRALDPAIVSALGLAMPKA